MKPDFSGYASKAGLKCADGLTILAHAFKDKHGKKVPLVWQHMHNDPDMVLGHTVVEDRPDGTYVYGYFNDGPKAQQAKRMITNGDIDSMSVFARRLVKRGNEVVHGLLLEVSLVLAGANPGASIDNVSIQHSDGTIQDLDDEAIIYTGLELEHADKPNEGDDVAGKEGDKTLEDVYETLNEEQKNLVHYLVGQGVLEHSDTEDDEDEEDVDDKDKSEDKEDSDDSDDKSDDKDDKSKKDNSAKDKKDLKHDDLNTQENEMKHRVFDQTDELKGTHQGPTLSHSQIETIVNDAKKHGSLKDSFLSHAGDFGIDDIDLLFPDAKAISNTPEFLSRRMEWVSEVLTKTKHSPMPRIKSLVADITPDEARAKGYVKGTRKTEEVFGLLHRITTPTTIYKKQKLDRDDILDITDLDVVAWLKAEMRLLLEEELARAILLGDGRAVGHADKVKDPIGATEGAGIRSIANDDEMYAHQVQLSSGTSIEGRIDELVRARSFYRGSGQPTLFTTLPFLTDMLLHKDKMGRRVYTSIDDLASALMAGKIVTVEPMEGHQDIVGIYVNLSDYTLGTAAGGKISFFDDFDIDYNQEKYLLETRSSGALTKLKSAVVVRRAMGDLVTPTSPSFDGDTNTITIPTKTGVDYQIEGETKTGDVVIDKDTVVTAVPQSGYDFPTGVTTNWTFVYTP